MDIVFCWLPSHVGIPGNEEADRQAKLSLGMRETNVKIPKTDFKPLINKYVFSKWQSAWSDKVNNKLFSIKPTLGESQLCYRSVRREEVVLTRCRIGHTQVTHSYLLKRDVQPECVFCQEPFTVKHFLLDCVDLALVRARHFSAQSMRELFNSTPYDSILAFLKEAGLYHRL